MSTWNESTKKNESTRTWQRADTEWSYEAAQYG